MDLKQGPAIYLTCEDDAAQLHWRQAHICRALGVDMAGLAGSLHLLSLRGEADNALARFDRAGRLAPAPLYFRLASLLRQTGAKLAALDNVAHLFSGNENDRAEVTQFVNLLNRLAGETGAATREIEGALERLCAVLEEAGHEEAVARLAPDAETIRQQLTKSEPSAVIIREAGRSLREIVESALGGAATAPVTHALATLGAALGLG